MKCDKCSRLLTDLHYKKDKANYVYFQCTTCTIQTSIKTGTILAGTKFSYRSFVLLVYVMTNMSGLTYDNSKFHISVFCEALGKGQGRDNQGSHKIISSNKPSPGCKRLLALSHLRHYVKKVLTHAQCLLAASPL